MSERWRNEPPAWDAGPGRLDVTTGPWTGLSGRTHRRSARDNGQLWGRVVGGDGSVTATFDGGSRDHGDQAGVMVPIFTNWAKPRIEHVDGVHQASVVAFHDVSITEGRPDGG